jgi:hypothetical protein
MSLGRTATDIDPGHTRPAAAKHSVRTALVKSARLLEKRGLAVFQNNTCLYGPGEPDDLRRRIIPEPRRPFA